jgi:Dolichyl-phosphate-mannose-protein mannosyltransferase
MTATQVADPAAARVGPGRSGSLLLTRRWTGAAVLVAVLTLVGIAIRLVVAQQSLFADELATYWDITTHSFGGLISSLYNTHIEITPPLFFVASWITAHIAHTPLALRLPSLLAGAATIPAVYLLGLRTVGRVPAVVASALTAFSPFMIYYSSEARAYGLMMLLVTLSTLSLLLAIDTRRRRWWVAYAVCTCAAFYTHYTSLFYLAVQFIWVLWAYPAVRREAVLATVAAAVGALPWMHAFINAGSSPTEKIMSQLSPFTVHDIRLYVEHWALGYPYANVERLSAIPGWPALGLLAAATIAMLGGLGRRVSHGELRTRLAGIDRRLVLVVGLLLSVPIGEAIVSATGDHLFGTRNLAASWAPLALTASALISASGQRTRVVAAALAVVALGLGATRMLSDRYRRPAYQDSAAFVDRNARSGDVVIDNTGLLSPGPLTGLDAALHRTFPIFRVGSPQERDHPYGFSDPIVSFSQAIPEAIAAAGSRGRIFVVDTVFPRDIVHGRNARSEALLGETFPAHYHVIAYQFQRGIINTAVTVYAPRGVP